MGELGGGVGGGSLRVDVRVLRVGLSSIAGASRFSSAALGEGLACSGSCASSSGSAAFSSPSAVFGCARETCWSRLWIRRVIIQLGGEGVSPLGFP